MPHPPPFPPSKIQAGGVNPLFAKILPPEYAEKLHKSISARNALLRQHSLEEGQTSTYFMPLHLPHAAARNPLGAHGSDGGSQVERSPVVQEHESPGEAHPSASNTEITSLANLWIFHMSIVIP
ncbi:hypothetical protein GOP47_0013864 [Adiantum capillus-veneris]|uniref:Uncharacterized protein n=1 Tax=Adiantum capillus-veneris TaxID=13818 RepID=A0A9D4UQK4_ADICA|nr:hypothetical protein GOP47_0013864 [Adiantum capillus-veneris]